MRGSSKHPQFSTLLNMQLIDIGIWLSSDLGLGLDMTNEHKLWTARRIGLRL